MGEDEKNKTQTETEEKINFSLVSYDVGKKRRIYIILLAIIAIFTVITSSILGVLFVNSNKEAEIEAEIPSENTVEEEPVEPIKPKIPVYSEEARIRMQNIYVADGEEKIAYLTFDDGPSSNITPQILDILKEEEVKATFFVLGSRAEIYPELVKREYEEGHYIANHGYSHIYQNVYSSPMAVLDEYNNAERIIKLAIRK